MYCGVLLLCIFFAFWIYFFAHLSVHVGKVSIIFLQKKKYGAAAQKYCIWMYDSVHLFWVFYASFLHEWNKINVICCTNVLYRGIFLFWLFIFHLFFVLHFFLSSLYSFFYSFFLHFNSLIHIFIFCLFMYLPFSNIGERKKCWLQSYNHIDHISSTT